MHCNKHLQGFLSCTHLRVFNGFLLENWNNACLHLTCLVCLSNMHNRLYSWIRYEWIRYGCAYMLFLLLLFLIFHWMYIKMQFCGIFWQSFSERKKFLFLHRLFVVLLPVMWITFHWVLLLFLNLFIPFCVIYHKYLLDTLAA